MFFKDLKRIKKLGKYLTNDKKTIYLILIVLLPVSFSGAIQPLLVGQAITILKNETTDVWLSKTFFGQSINAIIVTLSITVLSKQDGKIVKSYMPYSLRG
jgi:ATP-binding cassette subfamily B protein